MNIHCLSISIKQCIENAGLGLSNPEFEPLYLRVFRKPRSLVCFHGLAAITLRGRLDSMAKADKSTRNGEIVTVHSAGRELNILKQLR